MSNNLKLALIYYLQFIPIIIYPPSTYQGGWVVILVVVAGLLALGYFLKQGRSWALKLSIFIQGLNIIIRLMIGIAHIARPANLGGGFDGALIITSLLGILISGWFMFRLDEPDIQSTITA